MIQLFLKTRACRHITINVGLFVHVICSVDDMAIRVCRSGHDVPDSLRHV